MALSEIPETSVGGTECRYDDDESLGRHGYEMLSTSFSSLGIWGRVASPSIAVSSSYWKCTVSVLIIAELASDELWYKI